MNKEMRTNQPGILLMTDKDCALQITEAGLTVNGNVLPFDKAAAWIMEAFNEKAARNGCEYCDSNQWAGKSFSPENPMVDVCLVQDTLSVSNDEMAMNYKINFCPKCGKKLSTAEIVKLGGGQANDA